MDCICKTIFGRTRIDDEISVELSDSLKAFVVPTSGWGLRFDIWLNSPSFY